MRSETPAYKVLIVCLGLCWCTAAGETGQDRQPSLAEQHYQRALQLRARPTRRPIDLQEAASLLHQAADLKLLSTPTDDKADAAEPAVEGNSTKPSPGTPGTTEPASSARWWEHQGLSVGNDSLPESLFLLGALYDAGEGVPEDHLLAYHSARLAAEAGLPEAQRELGFRLALGLMPPRAHPREDGEDAELFEVAEPQVAESLLHYYFAAGSNDSHALLALGYRHLYGLGVPKSCGAAALYYHPEVLAVIAAARQPQGLRPTERLRLGQKGKGGASPTREQELLHYQWFADMGNADAQRTLGRILQQGNVPRDLRRAASYFRRAAEAGDAEAMAHLGHMYANGAGVMPSNGSAMMYFRAAAERNHPSGLFGLGFLYLSGRGTKQDLPRAFKLFTAAAKHEHVDAWFHLGMMHLKGWGTRISRHQATQLFAQAARMGHLLAMYNLAVLHLTDRQACPLAVELLKKVAERGAGARSLALAREAFDRGAHRQALLHYLRAADAGFELGQANAAWMLHEGYGFQGQGAASLAVRMWERAAQQGNVAALLYLGDAYYYGRGSRSDWARAGQVYLAASKQGSAQAMFNLGFQHQFGAGLPQDLHLAKRNYDRALEALPAAYLPVLLALACLWLHSWWIVIAPHLPGWCAWLKDWAFVVQPPPAGLSESSSMGSHAGLGLGWLENALEFSNWVELQTVERMNEALEGLVLMGLCVGLFLVLRRRRTLRAAALAPQQADALQAPAPVAEAPRPATAGADVREQGQPGPARPGGAIPAGLPPPIEEDPFAGALGSLGQDLQPPPADIGGAAGSAEDGRGVPPVPSGPLQRSDEPERESQARSG